MHDGASRGSWLLAFAGLVACGACGAVQTVNLPGWVCSKPDAIFIDGLQGGVAVPHRPSLGFGGAAGDSTRTLHVPNLGDGTQAYFIHTPPGYSASRAWPLLLVLHGVSPAPDSSAQTTRDEWSAAADNGGFIVAAPKAHDPVLVQGVPGLSWLLPPSSGATDYDEFDALLADVDAAYNIERSRIYVWGFSAGASVAHDLALNTYSTAFNAASIAAYAASSGALQNAACAGVSDAQCQQILVSLPRKVPVYLLVGNSDNDVKPYVAHDWQMFIDAGWKLYPDPPPYEVFHTMFVGTHVYYTAQFPSIWQTLCPFAVIP